MDVLTRIVIADGEALVRACLRRVLESEGGVAIVGEAADAAQTVGAVRALGPDVLVLGLSLTDDGLDVLSALRHDIYPPRVVLLTQSGGAAAVASALQLGARGVLFKESSAATIAEGIRRVAAGEYWIGQSSAPDLASAMRLLSPAVSTAEADRFGLTDRELEVIAAVTMGMSNREIAEQLFISEKTVKGHLTHIFDKACVSNRVELALFAARHRIGPRVRPSYRPAQLLPA